MGMIFDPVRRSEEMRPFFLSPGEVEMFSSECHVIQEKLRNALNLLKSSPALLFFFFAYLACVNGIIVGGLGGCWGTIRPRLVVGPPWCVYWWCCGTEMSPADFKEITPSPFLGWAV